MTKELLRQLISTLSGYSNPSNWTVVEIDNNKEKSEFIAWTGPEDPIKLAQNILDLVAKSPTMSKEEPSDRQYNMFYDV